MQGVVPFAIIGHVVSHKLLIAKIYPVLPCVVAFVADFARLHAPFAFAIETSDSLVVLVYDASFLCAVERFGTFVLGIEGGAESNERKRYPSL